MTTSETIVMLNAINRKSNMTNSGYRIMYTITKNSRQADYAVKDKASRSLRTGAHRFSKKTFSFETF